MERVVVKGDIGWKGGNTPSLWTRIMYRIDAKVMEVSSIHKTAKKEEIFYFVDDTSRVKNIVREKISRINIRVLTSFILKQRCTYWFFDFEKFLWKNGKLIHETFTLYFRFKSIFIIFFLTFPKFNIYIILYLYHFLKIFFLLNSVYLSILYSPIFKILMSF